MNNLDLTAEITWALKNKILRGVASIQRELETSTPSSKTPYYDLVVRTARESNLGIKVVIQQFIILYPNLRDNLESEIRLVNSETQEA